MDSSLLLLTNLPSVLLAQGPEASDGAFGLGGSWLLIGACVVVLGLVIALYLVVADRRRLEALENRSQDLEARWQQWQPRWQDWESLPQRLQELDQRLAAIQIPDLEPLQEAQNGLQREIHGQNQAWHQAMDQLREELEEARQHLAGARQELGDKLSQVEARTATPPPPPRAVEVRALVLQYLLDQGYREPKILSDEAACRAEPAEVQVEVHRNGVRYVGTVTVAEHAVADAKLQAGYGMFP
ncbi:MAG: hypothetical protein DWQ01_07745 [Planctomycetota bacterium]|nr:MAG: hypothetical protein DWQ01_07745 [Planctomycetota bacterium]